MNHIVEVTKAQGTCDFILPRQEDDFIVDALRSYEVESTNLGWINFINFDRYVIYLHGGETNIWHITEDFWEYAYASVEDSILQSDEEEEILNLDTTTSEIMMDEYYAITEALQSDLVKVFNHFQMFYAIIDEIDTDSSSEKLTWKKTEFFNQPLQEVW